MPADLAANTREMVAALVACGIDPRPFDAVQPGAGPAHAELQWLLNGTARMGWLNRMTQFKDKSGMHRGGASVGAVHLSGAAGGRRAALQATHVPVGEDQKQHLELARDIAQKFNNDFGVELFPIPQPLIFGAASRVMSLRDGTRR